MSVPFAFLSVAWNPTSGDAAFIPDEGKKKTNVTVGDLNPTPVTHFFDLWSDFDGRRLPVSHNRQWLDATALCDGNQIHVALTNMGGQSLNVKLVGIARPAQIDSIRQKRLFYRDGEIHYEPYVELASLDKVEVDVEETTIVTVKLRKPLDTRKTIERKFYYIGGTAMKGSDLPTDGFTNFGPSELEMMRGRRKSARLVVGVHRDGGLTEPLNVRINGTQIEAKHGWTNEISHLFAPVVLDIPDTVGFSKHNTLKIEGQEGLTITSIHLEIDRELKQ
jgi:agarase